MTDDDLFGPPPMEDEDSPFGKQGGLFSSGGGLFDDDNDNEVKTKDHKMLAALQK